MRPTEAIATRKLVLATSNRGKLAELLPLLRAHGFEPVTQDSLGVADASEDGASFVENAFIKARHACQATGLPALADDSGLIVDALGGAPGLLSARYSGRHGDSGANVRKLLDEMAGLRGAQRNARFYCSIVLLRHALDPQPLLAEGTWEGVIVDSPRGAGGFGYDPVFFDPRLGATAAELSAEAKNLASHRGQALAQLGERLAMCLPS